MKLQNLKFEIKRRASKASALRSDIYSIKASRFGLRAGMKLDELSSLRYGRWFSKGEEVRALSEEVDAFYSDRRGYHLAYSFLRGKKYREVENKTSISPLSVSNLLGSFRMGLKIAEYEVPYNYRTNEYYDYTYHLFCLWLEGKATVFDIEDKTSVYQEEIRQREAQGILTQIRLYLGSLTKNSMEADRIFHVVQKESGLRFQYEPKG